MKKTIKEVVSSVRLENFRQALRNVLKSIGYVQKELPRLRENEFILKKKISREKKAISLVNRAKRLR
ncbi:MAG: hypothetical protein AABY03_02145 [Nanoarchaeota archaeon]